MTSKVIIILCLLFSLPVLSQGEKVIISEKKKGKRLTLMAENKTSDTLSVFLMVTSEGYRRSADKPVLKDIPPQTTLPMITLIELRNVESSYTYELIVNNWEKRLEFAYDKEIVDIENAIRGKIVIFAMKGCEKCAALASQLIQKRIPYRMFDISKDPILYRQFMKFIEPELSNETRILFPVIWNRDHTIFGFEKLEQVVKELTE